MNKCTQEFLNLKNPIVIKTILQSVDKAALLMFLQQNTDTSSTNLKRMSKTNLIDRVIKTFDLPTPGCNAMKKNFYDKVLMQPSFPQSVKPPSPLTPTDQNLLNELVSTTDIQRRKDILNRIDSDTLFMLAEDFNIPNIESMSAQELRNLFIDLSSNKKNDDIEEIQINDIITPPPSPIVTKFLNIQTISGRREMLKTLNSQQLIVLAKYFNLGSYKNQSRDNIIKQLLYNIPPPSITSTKPTTVMSSMQIINGFRNAQTMVTRKEYLNTLDRRGMYILAGHYDIPNYKKKRREELFNDLAYKVPQTSISPPSMLATRPLSSSSCNIPQNIQNLSEKESKIVKAFMNATTAESKKKLLNSLTNAELLVLAQNFKIYDASSLNIAQLREQIYKNSYGSMSLEQMYTLAQNTEQRKKVLEGIDKRGLMALAKKYNIVNINKMPAEEIRKALYRLPYLQNPNTCGITSTLPVTRQEYQTLKICTSQNRGTDPCLRPNQMSVESQISTDINTPLNTPLNTVCYAQNVEPSPCLRPNQTSVASQMSASPQTFPTPPQVPSRKQISQNKQVSPVPQIYPSKLSSPQNRLIISPSPLRYPTRISSRASTPQTFACPTVEKLVSVKFIKAPIKVTVTNSVPSRQSSLNRQSLPSLNRQSLSSLNRQSLSSLNRQSLSSLNRQSLSNLNRQSLSSGTRSAAASYDGTRSAAASYDGNSYKTLPRTSFQSQEVKRATLDGVCDIPQEELFDCMSDDKPIVEISSAPAALKSDLTGLENLLDRLYEVYKDSTGVEKNRKFIRFVINSYLENNPLEEGGVRITTDNHTFMSHGVVLLDDNKKRENQVKQLNSSIPSINWASVSGLIGIGIVHLYNVMLNSTVANFFDTTPVNPYMNAFPNVTNDVLPTAVGFPEQTYFGFPQTTTAVAQRLPSLPNFTPRLPGLTNYNLGLPRFAEAPTAVGPPQIQFV